MGASGSRYTQYGDRRDCPKAPFFAPRGRSRLSPYCANLSRMERVPFQVTAAVETSLHAVDLFDWQPNFPVCVVFGNEVEGIHPDLSKLCDTHIRIPMLGLKHSLNVATAGGVVMYELLRKYRGAFGGLKPLSSPA